MPNKEDLSEQLNLTTKLASQVERMAAAAEKLEGSYSQQVETLTKIANVLGQLNVQGAVQSVEALNKSLTEMQGKMKDTGKTSETAFQKLGKHLKTVGDQLSGKFPKNVSIGAAALSGFAQGMRNVVALGKGLTSFFGSLLDGIINVTAAIIAIPFKMFERLIDFAAKSGGGMNELADAIEKLRKQFGSLSGPTNKAIIDTAQSLKGFKDTGLSAWRVFGNLAERLNYIRELATEMGTSFNLLRDEMEDNGGAILAYQKGLGLSGEQMKAVAQRSDMMGKKSGETLNEMVKYSYELGKALKLDAKVISREMGEAMKDMAHFGTTSVKSLGESVAFAHKFGLELKDITGTLDTFQSFDDAADHAAKLSQAFGVNIDAFEMMNAAAEGDAGKQIEILRDSFKAAGIDGSKFDNIQRKLIKDNTGMSDAAIDAAFSMNKQNVSLKDAQKAGDKAQKQTLTQADAMAKLSDAIERLVKSGGEQHGGFWDQFLEGFFRGVQSSKEFREAIYNIKRGLQLTLMEGVKLGRAFVDLFPGVKEFLQGIADFFNPQKIEKLVGGVRQIIEDWMRDLSDPNGKASFASLMEKLKDKFFDFFNAEAPAGKKMMDGFKKVLTTLSKIASEAIKWISDKIADGIHWVVDLLSGKVDLSGAAAAGKGGLGFLGQILLPLVDALKHAWNVIAPALWELIKTLGKKLFEFLKSDEFLNFIKPAIPIIAAVLFGPAFTRAILGAVTASLVKGTGSFLSGIGKKLMGGVASKAEEVTEAAGKAKGAGEGVGELEKTKDINKAAGEAIKAGKGWGVKDAVQLGLKLIAIATAIAVGGVEMALSVKAMRAILGDMKPEDAIAPMLLIAGMAIAAMPLMLAVRIIGKMGGSVFKDVILGGAAIALAVGIVGVTGALIALMMRQVGNPAELEAAGDIMLKMSLVFLAMVPLIFASMAIGALASGPQAILLGAAAIGMGVIGGAVAEMAGVVMGIVKELAKLQIDRDFQRKVDAFLSIMKAIQAFTDSMVKIIELMQPSLMDFITGTSETFTEKITAARGLMADMIGKSGGGTGIIGIVEVVMSKLKELAAGGPGMADAAKIFAEVLTAVTEALKALTPSDAFFAAGDSFLSRLSGPKPFTDLATDVAYYAKKMRETAMEMLTGDTEGKGQGGILGIIKKLAYIPIPDPASTKVVADLLNATAQMLKFLTPSPDLVKNFTTSVEQSAFWGLAKAKVEKVNTKGMTDVITTLGDAIKTILPVITGSVITGIVTQAKSIGKDDLDKVKVMVDVLKITTDLIQSISQVNKGPDVKLDNVQQGATVITQIATSAVDVGKMLDDIKDKLPVLVDAMKGVITTIPDDKKFKEHLEITKTLFSAFGEIPKMISALAQASGGGDTGEFNEWALAVSMSHFATFLMRLGSWDWPGFNAPLLGAIHNALNAEAIQKVAGDENLIKKTVPAISSLFSELQKTMQAMGALSALSAGGNMDIKGALGGADGKGGLIGAMTSLFEKDGAISKLSAVLTPDASKSFTEVVGKVKSFGDNMTALADVLKGTEKSKGGVVGALMAVSEMVRATNDLNKSLDDITKANWPAAQVKLKQVAQSVGLGGKVEYTVNPSREVVIHVNVQVAMDAQELEKVMIQRATSVIRNRIMWLGDNPETKGNANIPDNTGETAGQDFTKIGGSEEHAKP